jgi:hypothetical protein
MSANIWSLPVAAAMAAGPVESPKCADVRIPLAIPGPAEPGSLSQQRFRLPCVLLLMLRLLSVADRR